MPHIAIIFGGQSAEHEVSLASAASILKHLPPHYSPLLIGVDRKGNWYLQDPPPPDSPENPLDPQITPEITPENPPQNPLAHPEITPPLEIKTAPNRQILLAPGSGLLHPNGTTLPIHIAIPIIHGSGGEDGCLQGTLETLNIPYIGSPVSGSALGMDKDLVRRLWEHANLPVVKWRALHKEEHSPPTNPLLDKLFDDFGPVLFTKPARSGSSIGVSQCTSHTQLLQGLEDAWRCDNKLIVEKKVEGREIECAVIGNNSPQAFPPGEIITHSDFYDYNSKYIDADKTRLEVPARLSPEESRKIMEIAVAAYRCSEAKGLARVDFFIDTAGNIHLNEINTIPGMTPTSLFPRMVAQSGLDFPSMLERLIELGLEQHRNRPRTPQPNSG